MCYALKISFNYKFETENEFLKKCLLKCKLQVILTMQDCRVVLSQIGSMFNIPELYGAFAFPSLCIDPVAWPFKEKLLSSTLLWNELFVCGLR